MVLLDREMTSSYRLSVITTSLCASVWLQFALQCFHPQSSIYVHGTVSFLFTVVQSQ